MNITESEYNKIYNNTVASVRMEGLTPSEDTKKLCFDFINGKITKEDCIKILLERSKI